MKIGRSLGIACAVLVHLGILLFGRLLFGGPEEAQGKLQEVELLSEDDTAEEEDEKPEEPQVEDEGEEIESEAEEPPDAAEVIRSLELAQVDSAPALEAASLSAIEAALSGQALGGGDFAQAVSFASGGRIGGTGVAGSLDEKLDSAFNLDEIDQKPRAVFQASPLYPSSIRSKKLEGVVSVMFVVDAAGKVGSPKVERSNHSAFEKPALDAVKQWKFEPAVRGGQRVACRMRVSIRFPVSGAS